ncbi:MAG: GGDEF domain-containing protein [Mariprofundus sp.]|nr:GGDEF domain-containing protein [Mariprofundus sp.]
MNQRDLIEQLLDGMDEIRPIALAARPHDLELRATTRDMIAALEDIKRAPAIPAPTYVWLCHLTSKLLDAEHGALLKPTADGLIPNTAQQALSQHFEERQMLLMQALQDIPATHVLLDQSSEMIGNKANSDIPLQAKAKHLVQLLRDHLQHDTDLKNEIQQLIEAFNPSLSALSNLLEQAGEDSPELKQAQQILAQKLPDNIEDARALLESAHHSILQAGTKLVSASAKLNETIQEQVEKLSTLSSKLEQAESEARNDPLTGLANRRALAEYLKNLGQKSFCFLVIDIDHFKNINDTHGHDVGDEILQQLAIILQTNIRSTDLAARIGGEEFCIIFAAASVDISHKLADKLRLSIETHTFKTQQGPLNITVSIGLAEHIVGQTSSSTFKAADKGLYQSKRNGRNQVTITPTT